MKKIAGLLVLLFATLAAVAQQHPNQAKGFDPSKLYQFDSIDSINQFNGNLILTIPIGQRYPVSSALSYGLTLVYNGNPWDYSWLGFTRTLAATPSTRSNAGLGWLLSLGRLIDPSDPSNETHPPDSSQQHAFVYESPDGADHTFGNEGTLRQTVFALDDSNLRLTQMAADEQRVELPDGTIQKFIDRPAGVTTSGPDWRLTAMVDRFGNAVNVSYADGGNTWNITDSTGRSHQLKFRTVEPPEVTIEQTVLDSVDLAAFNGATARYTFSYADVSLTRPAGDNAGLNGMPGDPYTQKMLIGISLPNGESYSMMKSGAPAYDTAGTPAMLRTLTLPTLGRLEWDWGIVEFPEGSSLINVQFPDYPEDPDPPPPVRKSGVGVITRRKYDEKGKEIGTWQYARRLAWRFLLNGKVFQGEPCSSHVWDPVLAKYVDRENQQPAVMETILVQPADHPPGTPGDPTDTKCLSGCNMTVTYYSVYPHGELDCINDGPNIHGFTNTEYGLPINRYIDNGKRYLSMQNGVARGDATTSWLDNIPKTGMVDRNSLIPGLVRSRYAAFDAASTIDKHYETSSRTFDSPTNSGTGEYTESFNRMYDEGRPKLVVSGGTAGGITRYKATYTAYVALNRTDPEAPWILPSYTERCTTEFHSFPGDTAGEPTQPSSCGALIPNPSGDTTSTMETACFEPSTGYLNGRRVLKAPPTAGQGDVATLFKQQAGNTTDEAWFGGDRAGYDTPPTDLCTYQSTGSTYNYKYAYSHGSLSEAKTAVGSGWLYSVKQTIDASGLVSEALDAYDPNTSPGFKTTYTYDSLGRLTGETPASGASTEYRYTNASGTSLASVDVIRHPHNNTSAVLAQTGYQFDALGRLFKQTLLMPSGSTSTVLTQFYPAGTKSKVSEQELTPQHFTTFEYDALGRITSTTAPDNRVTTVSYSGFTTTATVNQIATSHPVSFTAASNVETRDSFGRLIKVTDGAGTTATYTYDVMDHLRKVDIDTSQHRVFEFDPRGFLVSETHPESNTITNSGFDAKGHAVERAVAGGPSLTFVYDGAERLTNVTQGGTSLKEFFYDSVTGSDNTVVTKPGRLLKTIRHNPILNRDVTEYFKYDDRLLLSSKETVISDPNGAVKFTQPVSHDELGLTNTVTYPALTVGQTASTALPDRAVNNVHVNGMLTEVEGFTKANTPIQYAANGMLSVLTHANGVTDTIGLDPNGMRRPASFSFAANLCPVPAFTVLAQPSSLPSGTPARIVVTPTDGATGNTYEFFEGSTTDPNTSSLLAPPGPQAYLDTGAMTATRNFWVRVTSACGKQASSSVITIQVTSNVCNPPTVTTQPASPGNVAAGTYVHLTVGTSATGVSYQWYANGAPVLGGTSSTLDYQVSTTTSFYAAVSTCATTFSNIVTATVNVSASCSQPVATVSADHIFAGQSVTVSTDAAGTAFEWHSARQGYVEDTPVSVADGGHTRSITVRPQSDTRYWVFITSPCNSVASEFAQVSIDIPPNGDLNSDGHADLVWRNYTSGDTWITDEYTSNQLKVYYGDPLLNPDWHINGFADVDGDYYPDLIWHNNATGANTLWSLASDPSNPYATPIAKPLPTITTGGIADPDWRLVGAADIDGGTVPRQAELFFRNYRTGADRVIWPSSDGTSITTSLDFTAETNLDWKIVGVIGYDDVLHMAKVVWRNTSNGQDRLWYLSISNGTIVTSPGPAMMTDSDQDWQIEGAGNFDGFPEPALEVLWRSQRSGNIRVDWWNGTMWVEGFPPNADIRTDARIQIAGDFDACVTPTPAIAVDPSPTVCGGAVTLTASASPTRSSYSYRWSTGEQTAAITVTTSGTYTVTVTSPEGCSATKSVKITVAPATKPVITASNGAAGTIDITTGEQVVLTATSAKTYLWSNQATGSTISVGTAGVFTVTTTDSNGCSATSDARQVVVHPLPPSNVAATASLVNGAYRVTVSWVNPPNTAYQYVVQRSTDGIHFTTVSNPDTSVVANKTYIYRVYSTDGTLNSLRTPMDLATTMTFTDDPLVRQTTPVKRVHVTEVRAAIDSVRAAAGLSAATWTPITAGVTPITTADFTDMRARLDEALNLLAVLDPALGPTAYTDPVLQSGQVIKIEHVQQLRERLK